MNQPAPGVVPEDSFRVEGHCCAITLPGVKESPEGIRFEASSAAKNYLAALGIGESAPERADAEEDAEGVSPR